MTAGVASALVAVFALVAAPGCNAEKASVACAEDVDCPAGEGICRDGTCVVLACRRTGDCSSGTCNPDGVCEPAECDGVRHCGEGFVCRGGLCRSPQAEGDEVGVTLWDGVTPPDPRGPDARRDDAFVPPPPPPDARPDAPVVVPADAAPPPDVPPGPDGPPPDGLVRGTWRLTFSVGAGDCADGRPASDKDLTLLEDPAGTLSGRITEAEAGAGAVGMDLGGARVGTALSLHALAPPDLPPPPWSTSGPLPARAGAPARGAPLSHGCRRRDRGDAACRRVPGGLGGLAHLDLGGVRGARRLPPDRSRGGRTRRVGLDLLSPADVPRGDTTSGVSRNAQARREVVGVEPGNPGHPGGAVGVGLQAGLRR